jgi:hypothetical protein
MIPHYCITITITITIITIIFTIIFTITNTITITITITSNITITIYIITFTIMIIIIEYNYYRIRWQATGEESNYVSLESGDFFPCQAFFLPRTLFPDIRTNFLPLIKGDFFPCWTFSFPRGCFVPKDVLSHPDVFSLRTFCPPRRFVPPDVLSRRTFFLPDVFSHGRFVTGRLVAGHFVIGRFVWAPIYYYTVLFHRSFPDSELFSRYFDPIKHQPSSSKSINIILYSRLYCVLV